MKKRVQELLQHYLPQRSDSNCAAALLCLILATFLLSVVVFTFAPMTAAGLVSTALGAFCMFGCICFFVRYRSCLKREEQQADEGREHGGTTSHEPG